MKKVLLIALLLTLLGFIPVIQQQMTGCAAFGYDHLVTPLVITTADSCSTRLLVFPLALPLGLAVQLSRLLITSSVVVNYVIVGLLNFGIYCGIGAVMVRFSKSKGTSTPDVSEKK